MINISQSLGMQTLFIRYNPDKYKVKTGNKILNEKKRLDELVNLLNHYKNKGLATFENIGFCLVTYLFFDDDNKEDWFKPIKLL
jgi:hypothetical protein